MKIEAYADKVIEIKDDEGNEVFYIYENKRVDPKPLIHISQRSARENFAFTQEEAKILAKVLAHFGETGEIGYVD